jgi:COP9 signalosome complex subunit 12
MAQIFADFHEAHSIGSGQLLASCLVPVETTQDSRRLHSFSHFSDVNSISADVRYHLFQTSEASFRPPKIEAGVWVDIFVALWTTVQELSALQEGLPRTSWSSVFDAYKELTNSYIRGYSNGFPSWTIPGLYVTGKQLRSFAIKADAEAKAKDNGTFGNEFSDDVMGNLGKNEKLEQAAWVLSKMFTTCLSDR